MFCKKVSEKSKTAITFTYDVGKNRIIYQNVPNENPHPIETAYGMFANFQNPQILKGKKVMLKFQFFLILVKSGQTVVKLLIQEVLVLLNNYSRILVLLNNYFSFFEFWSNLAKLWSNNGQTTYSRNISVTK